MKKWVAYSVKQCFAEQDLVFFIKKFRDFLHVEQHLA